MRWLSSASVKKRGDDFHARIGCLVDNPQPQSASLWNSPKSAQQIWTIGICLERFRMGNRDFDPVTPEPTFGHHVFRMAGEGYPRRCHLKLDLVIQSLESSEN
jgi:hypothetical protein